MKKTLRNTLLLCAVPVFLFGCSKEKVIVESKAGTITEEAYYQNLEKTGGEHLLRQMIFQQMLEKKYKLTSAMKEDFLIAFMKKNNFSSETELKKMLKERNVSYADFLNEITFSALLKKASLDEIKNLEKLKEEKYNDQKKQIKVRHILVQSEDQAIALLKDLKKNPSETKFEQMAIAYSVDHASKQNGGNLGFISKGQMPAAFDEVAFTLKKQSLSNVVSSEFGFHIIMVTDIKEVPFHELASTIEEQLLTEHVPDPMTIYNKLLITYEVEAKDEHYDSFLKADTSSPDILEKPNN